MVLDSAYFYNWDSETNDWIGSGRYVFAYDANGNQTERVYYEWDSETNDWIGYSRHIYFYDTNGNQTEEVYYYWDSETNDWIGSGRYVFAYDANGNQTELVSYEWDSEINDWINAYKSVYYWSELTTTIGTSSEYQECIIYPNPTNEILTIQTNKGGHYSIEITSLNGQLIYSTNMDGTSHQINLSSFQKGVYFVTVRSADLVTTEKIIKL